MRARIDHIIVGVADLEQGVQWLRNHVGADAIPGGAHTDRGTHNALLCGESHTYLELLAPDASQQTTSPACQYMAHMHEPAFAWWCMRHPDLHAARIALMALDVECSDVETGLRETSDGTLLQWQLLFPRDEELGSSLPFLINWGSTPHPSQNAAPAFDLRRLVLEGNAAPRLRAILDALGLNDERVLTVASTNRHQSVELRFEDQAIILTDPQDTLLPSVN